MAETVGFTGSRTLPQACYPVVERAVAALPDGTLVVTGGCIGVDDYVAYLAHRYGFKVHGVIPADRSRVPPGWRDIYDTYEQMPMGSTYRQRDERLVEISDRLIALPLLPEDAPQSRRSGTWMTVRIARSTGKSVEVHDLFE